MGASRETDVSYETRDHPEDIRQVAGPPVFVRGPSSVKLQPEAAEAAESSDEKQLKRAAADAAESSEEELL